MDFESVKQLADLMDERGLSRIEVCEGDRKISLAKELTVAAQVAAGPPPAPQSGAARATAGAPEPPEAALAVGEALTSPLVGVVYLSPKPGDPPFAGVGDRVKQGQTLCIVEAMKVMNEFTAPRDGEIVDVCVENEELVEFGQVLFRMV